MFDSIADRKIAEAIAAGELDNLPGTGKPLELDDDSHVPEDLRAAYRILKNAGYVPPEVETLNQIAELERLVMRHELEAAAHSRAVKKLALLKTRVEAAYCRRAIDKLGR